MAQNKMANIHPNAKVAESAVVEAFATVEEDVVIGEGTWIGPNAVVMNGARIGKNCKVFPGAVVSAEPQDLKYQGEESIVTIGDNTTIRECVTVNKGTSDRMETKIGNNCLLMAYVHVAHDTFIGDNVIVAVGVALAGHMDIEDYVIIEGMAGAQQFVKIGAHSFIAAYSQIRKNVPPFIKCAREPLSYTGVNTIGLRRRGWDDEAIREIENIYRTLYVHNKNILNALNQIEEEYPDSPHKRKIVDFIKNSENGIVKRP
ncbi:acyl-ACP--UDP-N-acetylglucosamine O-acyltransferase [Salibacter sp.]|uniref:acyl-ACP--UDP-N-acetylglucosamine O-acyltransferase n=1 Tax=Salibacter sp. TaxID=2010995 RepID=UPI0028704D27|nr:acyl-ACP--UDP-N-acetylglucosamine O-acyltransferase [Salibacter sp.]MDR9398674.1 acyl-ACP--UDP-N-acetylglucosamine O-acyltransferase [Salibacter sp.]MDR9487802.1 acyl-ACP--UDP-N-acetylglucosamine O-acyltransferase [Salibacter sp.]